MYAGFFPMKQYSLCRADGKDRWEERWGDWRGDATKVENFHFFLWKHLN